MPQLKRLGCDVVVVAAHSGATTSSSYGDALPYPENASSLVAEQVPGIDAILVGHAHVDIPQKLVTNTATGRDVLLCEPDYWGMRLAVMELDLGAPRAPWSVVAAHVADAELQRGGRGPAGGGCRPRPARQGRRLRQHRRSAPPPRRCPAARAPVEDVPIIDFVNYVQADAVKQGLTGADAALPVLSIAAPFNRSASFPAGDVTVRDVAGLYIYDNILLRGEGHGGQASRTTSSTPRSYFKQVPGPGTYAMADVTNAVTPTAPNGTPDYNFDSIAGLDAR